MKVTTHVILQVLGFIVTIGTVVSGQVPPKYVPYVVGIVSAAQGGLAWFNHYFTPQGARIEPGK